MKKILNTDLTYFSINQKKILKKYFLYEEKNLKRKDLLKIIPNFHIIISRFSHNFNKEFFNKAKNLETIVSYATGLNHIDLNQANKNNVKIISLKNEISFLKNIHSSSEFTFLLLLSLFKKLYESIKDVKVNLNWNRDTFIGADLHGNTLGILGYGRIGKKIAKYAKAFGMNVLIYDKDKKKYGNYNKATSIKNLFQRSLVVSINIDYNSKNHNLINKENLKYLHKNSFLINTSRGEVINENDLLNFLKKRKIKAVALDVLSNEQNLNLKKNKLILYAKKNDNLIITPHIAGATLDSFNKTQEYIVKKLLKHYKIRR